MFVNQLSIFLQNRPGHLANITKILKDGEINIRAINVTEGNDFGILRLIVDDTYKAQFLLQEDGYLCKVAEVLAIEPEDKIGIMNEIFEALAKADINVNYIYSIIRSIHGQLPIIIIKTSDQDKALKVLSDLNISFVNNEEIIIETEEIVLED